MSEVQEELNANKERMNTSEELLHWQVVAASVRGRSHEKVGQLCQDAHHWEMLPEGVLVAAVADGAGSATLGKVGAIVAAQTAVETISLSLKDAMPRTPENEQGWQLLLNNALVAAKTAVEAEAVACSMTARDLATTLIIVVATPKLIAAAQVGDGVAVASDEGNLLALTMPQRGEYANETTFLVSPNALDKAQINVVWRKAITNIALLSDGLQMLALDMTEGKPHVPFFSPLFHFMADVTDETEAKEQLVAFLRSPRIAERTDDDLTLLLATLVS